MSNKVYKNLPFLSLKLFQEIIAKNKLFQKFGKFNGNAKTVLKPVT